MRYSAKERLIAKSLSAFPGLKQFLKRSYQALNFLLYKKLYAFQSIVPVQAIEDSGLETFFGYYDKSPESECGTYLLYHTSIRKTTELPSANEPIEVVCKCLKNDQIIYKKASFAYNWQQGTRLHWIGKDTFVFNIYEENKGYRAVVVRILSNSQVEELYLDKPIYESSTNGFYSLSFEKLNLLRPDYGYRCHENTFKLNPEEEGIYFYNKSFGKWDQLVNLQSLTVEFPIQFEGILIDVPFSLQKFNHIMVSPSGDRIVFLHRFYHKSKRIDRLFYFELATKTIKLLNRSSMVSHYCWKNDQELLVFMADDVFKKDAYFCIQVETGVIDSVVQLSDKFGDGHPQSYNGKWMIFDTYPNKSRMKELFFYKFESENPIKLGEFLEPLSYFGETRCDLHPRINVLGNKVYVDTVHTGKRQLLLLDLRLLLQEKN